MSLSQILRIPSGFLNDVNNPAIGEPTAPSPVSLNSFSGQLGKEIVLDASQIRYKSSVGTVFGGTFRYVRLKANSAVPVIGQMVFWDDTVAEDLYQVTVLESITTVVAASMAGIILTPSVTVGNCTLIQTSGLVKAKFVGTITGTKATGRPVSISVAGTSSIGLMDIVDDLTTTAGELLLSRYVGRAVELPTDGGLTTIDLQLQNPRG